jgi:hypothetical protein
VLDHHHRTRDQHVPGGHRLERGGRARRIIRRIEEDDAEALAARLE